jgi:hypothetical protein
MKKWNNNLERSRLQTNALNAQAKLLKYRLLLVSPVYILAVVLVPWYKWSYFVSKWNEDKVASARVTAFTYFKDHYSSMVLPEVGAQVQAASQRVRLLLLICTITNSCFKRPKEPDLLDDFMRIGPKVASRSSSLKDEWDRYCLSQLIDEYPEPKDPKEEKKGPLYYWGLHAQEFPRLAQLARDILSIPGMSAEVERLFSSAKLMLPDNRSALHEEGIEAGECIRSWMLNELL